MTSTLIFGGHHLIPFIKQIPMFPLILAGSQGALYTVCGMRPKTPIPIVLEVGLLITAMHQGMLDKSPSNFNFCNRPRRHTCLQ
jgi:hypothetical protein